MRLPEKYRPRTFEQVLGQDLAVQWCLTQIARKAGQSVLFYGPSGSGKTSLAQTYAKALNCDNLNGNGSPCGVCQHCESFDEKNSFFALELNGAEKGGIDSIKDLLKRTRVGTPAGKWRVFVVHEAHDVSPKSWSAMLRELESPRLRTLFIFTTTELEKVPQTVTSRIATLELKPLDAATGLAHLRLICQAEGFSC